MSNPPLDSADLRKRQSWAERQGVQTYIQEMGEYAVRRDQAVLAAFVGQGPGRALDMPCGSGRFLGLLKERGFAVTAADYSPPMLEEARRRHPDIEIVRGDIFNPPFAPETFDLILVSRLLFHYAQSERIIAALLPCLKPGGRMVFDTLNAFSTRWLASKLLQLVRRDPARRLYFQRPSAMRGTLAALGLEVLDRRSAYLLPTRLYRRLPRALIAMADLLEKLAPVRVLTFWHVKKLPIAHCPLPIQDGSCQRP